MANTIDNMNSSGVSWFKFDEASGNVTDSKGTAVGIVTGATRVTETNGYSLNFDGNDYVTFNGKVIPTGATSIKFKMKRTSIPSTSNDEVISNSYIRASDYGIRIWVDTSGNITVAYCGKVTDFTFTLSTPFIFDNQWHDVLFTWDGTTNANGVKLYLDDMETPKAIGRSTIANTNTPSYNLTIGKLPDRNERYFYGQLDDLEIYNHVISGLSDKSLVLHDGQYKHYTTSWQSIGVTATFLDYKEKGMNDISLIPESAWLQLNGSVELSYWSDFSDKTEVQFNIETTPFTLADEFKGKEIKILEYTDNLSRIESTVETEVEPYSIYDEFGDAMEVLYYTDDATKTKAELEITANYSPLDELEGDYEVVTWSNAVDEVIQESIPQITSDIVEEGTVYETPLNLENVVKVK